MKNTTARRSEQDVSFRVIADHARTAAFAIADGVVPTNEGRGYVLRRIMRRALRHGRLLGFEGAFFSQVAGSVVQLLGSAYPELVERRDYLTEVIHNEETRFSETLDKGLALLEQEIHDLRQRNAATLSGETAFRLYDTYGFPLDMTEDFLASEGFSVDHDEFQKPLWKSSEHGRVRGKRVRSLSAPGCPIRMCVPVLLATVRPNTNPRSARCWWTDSPEQMRCVKGKRLI